MPDSPAGPESCDVRCPHCGSTVSAQWDDLGETVTCPKCAQPFDAPAPEPAGQPAGRPFQFQCLRCGSVLEARASQCGTQGRCPSCSALFLVPQVDVRTGLARTNADPGDDGEYPAPVHAYAAAGEMAPRILRKEDDSLWIQCSRCQAESPISRNTCSRCGIPFTMEGMGFRPATGGGGGGTAALALGLIALPLSACGGVGVIPGVIAIILGAQNWSGDRKQLITAGRVAVGLGLIASLLSAALSPLWRM